MASRCCSSSASPRLSSPGALLYASASTTTWQPHQQVSRPRRQRCKVKAYAAWWKLQSVACQS